MNTKTARIACTFTILLWFISGQFIHGASLNSPISPNAINPNQAPNVSYASSLHCNTPNLPIPSYNPAGITDTLTITTTGLILDLNISVVVTHTWVGDLLFIARHVDTGTSVTIIDRPGAPATFFGCPRDNIDAILDDEALLPVEDECALTEPTIHGSFIPNNLLNSFDGEDLSGTWAINAIDPLGADIGTLYQWCVIAEIPVTATPTPTKTPTPTETLPPITTTHTPSITQTATLTPSPTLPFQQDYLFFLPLIDKPEP